MVPDINIFAIVYPVTLELRLLGLLLTLPALERPFTMTLERLPARRAGIRCVRDTHSTFAESRSMCAIHT